MLTVRGTYDGKEIKVLPDEQVPIVEHVVPVAIVFLDEPETAEQRHWQQIAAAERLMAAHDAMEPLGMSVKDLIEQGRER